ncbi:Putative Coiled-coil domain-containing protein [Septoria linicola]|uniref:Coiled-coil domain-containing protein n=1 Tax=Septoria linicola TaxID=215465 RepID=A0A9Q9EPL6_9PEZI|nr:putative Coiled-coil domain-containing protein [Septoria linicola]USW57857.1 Putative Coiled-coil domain-containing protein [Septoria linicola]
MSVPSVVSRAVSRGWTSSSMRPTASLIQHGATQTTNSRPERRTTATAAFARNAWAERRASIRPTCSIQHAAKRAFSATSVKAKDHHFDTLKFVQRLQQEGFTEEQSRAMMVVLSDVIEESIQNLTRTMVLREDQEKATYTQKVDFAKLRSELLSADSTESSLTRASHERLSNEVTKLNNRLRDEVQRTQSSVRLDLNLEKGRIREEANSQDLKIKETETRIEQESAALRERLEAVKFSTLQWLMGVCTGTAAIILGVWRLLM